MLGETEGAPALRAPLSLRGLAASEARKSTRPPHCEGRKEDLRVASLRAQVGDKSTNP